MGINAAAAPVPTPRPVRAWPTAALAAVYWIFQIVLGQLDVPMFTRFMSNALSSLAFLLVFVILWLSNGTVRGRLRLALFGVFVGSLVLGLVLADSSYTHAPDGKFNPVSFMLSAVPIVLTVWAAGLVLVRDWAAGAAVRTLAIGIPLCFFCFDLTRWDGLDGRLKASYSFRWSKTTEDSFLLAKAAAASSAPSTKPWSLKPGDCPEFRGAQRDGVVRGVRIETNWKEGAPSLVWKQRVGPGWSSVIAVDGFLVTQEQRGESEAVVCYDAETGKEVWKHEDKARFSEGIAGPGPRATPTFREGRIYSLGGGGLATCLEARDGKVVWTCDLGKDNSAPPPMWGYSASPLLIDGKVILFAGGLSARGIVALDAATGAPVWSKLVGKESYCSAQLVTSGGKPQLLMQDNTALAGLAVADGAVLWKKPYANEGVIPMLQSVQVEDGKVLVASGTGLALIELREEGGAWTVAEKWSAPRFQSSFSNFVLHEGYVYGLDQGALACVDAKSGARVWKKGRFGSGQLIVLADQGQLVVLSETGELALVDAKPSEPGDLFRFAAIEGKTWNSPTVAQNRLIVRNGVEMACFRLKALKSP